MKSERKNNETNCNQRLPSASLWVSCLRYLCAAADRRGKILMILAARPTWGHQRQTSRSYRSSRETLWKRDANERSRNQKCLISHRPNDCGLLDQLDIPKTKGSHASTHRSMMSMDL